MESRKEWLAAVLCSVATTALFFRGPLFFPSDYHIPYDIEEYHQPLSELIAWSLRETGRLPWWNPFSYMGEPFFANVQAAMFYPPTLLTAIAGNALFGRVTLWLMELQLMAHVALAGAGTYALLRLFGTTMRAALAGATVYQAGAFFASQTQHLGAVSAAGWLPWLIAALYRLEQRRDWFSATLAGLAFAMMIMAGFPAAYLPALLFVPLLYGLWLWQRRREIAPTFSWRHDARAVVLLGSAVLLALLVTAVSWLPGYQVSKRSLATLRPMIQAVGGFWPEAATSFVWPNLFNQLRGDCWLVQENTSFLHLYQGIPAMLLVLGALAWLAGAPRSRPFLVAAAVALLWMFGKTFFVAEVIYLIFPSFVRRGIYPQYVLAYFSLFFSMLAAFVIDAYERGERPALFNRRFCWRIAALAAAVGMLVSAAGVFAPSDSPVAARAAASGNALLVVALALALCGFVALGRAAGDPAARARAVTALCAVILFDLLAIGSHTQINTYAGPGDVPPDGVSFLQARLPAAGPYRMDTSELGYNWQAKVAQWRLPSANGMNPLMLRDTAIYRLPFSHMNDRQFTLGVPETPLLDLAGIRYIVTARDQVAGAQIIYKGDVNIFENPRAFPRFFLVGGVVPAKDVGEAVRMIHTREVDPSRVAVVLPSDLARFAGLAGPAASPELGEVQVLSYSPNEIRLRVRAARPAVLIATEAYWPDWRAAVDGAPATIARADAVFRAVPVPAGSHEIRMFIVPVQLYLGAGLSAFGLFIAMVSLWLPAARRGGAAVRERLAEPGPGWQAAGGRS